MQEDSAMILLDGDSQWSDNAKVVAHWARFDPSPKQESIPQKVEQQALFIKKDYLCWVYELGKCQINNETLISHLQIFNNLSFWWMTKVAAKSPFLSPGIYQIFKLRVLEKMYLEKGCNGLIYCGNNQLVHQVLRDWCKELGHPYKRISEKKCQIEPEWTGIKRLVFNLPYWLQVLLFLVRKWVMNFRHIRSGNINKKQQSIQDSVTVVTFFPNIDLQKANDGRFYSRYWEKLHQLLDELPFAVNWVWLYSKSGQITYRDSIDIRNKCNQHSPDKYRHFLLEEFFNLKTFIKCVSIYLKLYSKGLQLKGVKKFFKFPASKLNFFPMLQHDWNSSLFGKDAMEGIIYSFLFDSMAKAIPAKPWGLFLFENQPYESALISAWKRHQRETKILAHQHATIRALDFRLLYDPRVFGASEKEKPPMADVLGLNSPDAYRMLRDSKYPIEKIVKIEALRYWSLLGNYGSKKKEKKISGRTLLVLTAQPYHETVFQLNLLHEAACLNGLAGYDKILIKSHNDFPVKAILDTLNPEFKYSLTSKSLDKLWSISDTIYCSNSTTACIEAGYLGLPVIVAGQKDNINLNPLYGFSTVNFVTDIKMLCQELNEPSYLDIPEDYFYLDETFKLWRKLLCSR